MKHTHGTRQKEERRASWIKLGETQFFAPPNMQNTSWMKQLTISSINHLIGMLPLGELGGCPFLSCYHLENFFLKNDSWVYGVISLPDNPRNGILETIRNSMVKS